MTTAAFAHPGATPLLSLPARREVESRDVAVDDIAQAAHLEGVDITVFIPSTEIWLKAPTILALNYDRLFDDACDVFGTSRRRTYHLASRSIHGTYGREVESPLSGSWCSVLRVSGALDQDLPSLVSPHGAAVAASAEEASADVPGAVETVLDLARRLGVTEADIYRAAGIKGRTFKHWKKKPGTMPRPDSLGTLWSLASAVDDLAEHLSDQSPARWLRERSERFEALKAGRFRQLVDESLGLLTVSSESTAHREGLILVEEAQSIGEGTTENSSAAGAQGQAWVLDDETPTKVVLD